MVEDLGEEGPERDGGAEETIAEGGTDLAKGVVNLFLGQMMSEGESFAVLELAGGVGDLACGE